MAFQYEEYCTNCKEYQEVSSDSLYHLAGENVCSNCGSMDTMIDSEEVDEVEILKKA